MEGRQAVPYFKVDPAWASEGDIWEPAAFNSINVINVIT